MSVVGRVLRVQAHPGADRLRVCLVDAGSETLSIVCGAPNVAEGMAVAVARVGDKLAPTVHSDAIPGAKGLKIKASKVRGERSEGMLCSAQELDWSSSGFDAEGIVALGEQHEPVPGEPLAAWAERAGEGPFHPARLAYEGVLAPKLDELGSLAGVSALLSWDQETMMPPKAAAARAAQSSALAGVVHDREQDPELRAAVEQLLPQTGELDAMEAANVRAAARQLHRAWATPRELAVERARLQSEGIEAWKAARSGGKGGKGRFKAFAPALERLLDNARAVAAAVEPELPAYDAMLDEFSPGSRATAVDAFFAELVPGVQGLLADLDPAKLAAAEEAQAALPAVPAAEQRRVAQALVGALGYDLEAGRLDDSAHPFTINLARDDVRITSRFPEHNPLEGLTAAVHEAGHALYEQNLPAGRFARQPVGAAAGLAVHESQSLLWERMVAHLPAFWQFAAGELGASPLMELAQRAVRPGLVRVEADEVTYGLHVFLRFDIERRLVAGELAVRDVPAAWNAAMHELLGVEVPGDALGCLQDVHWSMGAFGYFPTYAQGAVYAHHLFSALAAAEPDLDAQVARGDFSAIRAWLAERVWRHGSAFASEQELVEAAAGAEVSVGAFVGHLRAKYCS